MSASVLEPARAVAAQGRRHTATNAEQRSIERWAMLLPILAALAARLFTGPQPIDDAYITFRYARNLAEGLGLVYNPGEWVLGTTAPLWAALLAAGYRLGITDLPLLASSIASVCDAASAVILTLLARGIGLPLGGAILVGLAWAINPMSIGYASGGMETSLFVLVCLVSLALAARGTRGSLCVAAALAGTGVLVRPESVLVATAVVAWGWLTRRREALRIGLFALVPMLTAAALLTILYSSPLPQSVAAKQVAYTDPYPRPLFNLLAVIITLALPGASNHLLAVVPPTVGIVLATGGVAGLVCLLRAGVPWLARRPVGWQTFAILALLLLAFYTLIGARGARLFPWYLVPLIPIVLLGAAAGLTRLGGSTRPWLAAVLLLWQLPAIDWSRPFLPAGHNLEREVALLEVGQSLRQTLPPTALVAAPEIGALGYASNLRILDTVGLVSPGALAYYPLPVEQYATDNAIPPRLILEQQPDAVVTLDGFARASVLADPAFRSAYRLERTYRVHVWDHTQLLVFLREAP